MRRSRHHNPRPERPSNLRTLRTFGTKSRQPSHRRCVQCCSSPPSSRAGLHVGMGQMENALMILGVERSPTSMPPVPSEGEISPLRFASVEMTGGGGPAFFKSAPEGHGASPFGGWRHHLARWEACHWIRGSRGSPMNPVPLPPPQAVAL